MSKTKTKNVTKTVVDANTAKHASKRVDEKTSTVDAIESLLESLNACDDQRMKKMIRAKLRRLGHYGATRTSDVAIISKIDATKRTLRAVDMTTRQHETA